MENRDIRSLKPGRDLGQYVRGIPPARFASLATLKVAGLFHWCPMLPLSPFSDAYRENRRAAFQEQKVIRQYGIDLAEVLRETDHAVESFDREWIVGRLAQGPITCGEAHGPIIDYGHVELPSSIGDFDDDYAEYYGD